MGIIKDYRRKRLLELLDCTNSEELGTLLRYILYRYSKEYPNEDFLFLTLPKNDPAGRNRTLEALRSITDNKL